VASRAGYCCGCAKASVCEYAQDGRASSAPKAYYLACNRGDIICPGSLLFSSGAWNTVCIIRNGVQRVCTLLAPREAVSHLCFPGSASELPPPNLGSGYRFAYYLGKQGDSQARSHYHGHGDNGSWLRDMAWTSHQARAYCQETLSTAYL
jgi:hypothetical protein